MKKALLKNDAYKLLSSIVQIPENELESFIIERLEKRGLLTKDQDFGWSIEQIAFDNNMTVPEIVFIIFGTNKHQEVPELLKAIIFWGDGVNYPCPKCGCECEVSEMIQSGHSWNEWACTNSYCDYEDSNEPDWDILTNRELLWRQ